MGKDYSRVLVNKLLNLEGSKAVALRENFSLSALANAGLDIRNSDIKKIQDFNINEWKRTVMYLGMEIPKDLGWEHII